MDDAAGARARWAQVREIVEAALLLPVTERAAFLATITDNDDLRLEAEQVLAFDSSTGDPFPVTSWRDRTGSTDETALEDSTIGNYRILRELGRGGMGAVYLAERADGSYDQFVALKIVQEGAQSFDMERRFRLERQILSSLTHPNIARMLDGGVTTTGRPYFVMEYVEGVPIDQYCDEQHLGLRDRLKLFLKLSEAVQAAHQQFVLHLDIKPANILITPQGEPRLLDFGIARLLQENHEGLVQPSLMLMTPRYASPEQAGGKALGVGSDVFSLATLLYVLLTGTLPYPIGEANALEAARIIREQEPTLPSRAAFSLNEQAFQTQLQGDLDMILMKCLRKEPERRYATVAAFRDDLQRYLDSRPVLAQKDTLRYRATKFFRRNRIPVAATAVMLVVIAASVAAAVHSDLVARRERAAAELRLHDIQELARFYVDDLFPSLSDIPGTLPVRKKMTENAVKYLQSMTQERAHDPAFSKDLGSGLFAMAMVQGFPNEPNLGDLHGAQKLFILAGEMNERHAREAPDDPDNLARKGLMLASQSNIVNALGDVPAAIALEQQAWDTVQPILRGPKSRRFQQISTYCFFQAVYHFLNNQFNMADPATALVWIERAEQLLVVLGQDKPEFLAKPLYVSQLANVRLVKADAMRALGRNVEARALFEDAMRAVDAQNIENTVEIAKHRRDVHSEYAEFLLSQGDLAQATAVSAILRPKRSAAMAPNAVSFDLIDYAADAEWWAVLCMHQGKKQEAMDSIRDSLAATRLVLQKVPDDQSSTAQHVSHLIRFAELPGMDPQQARTMFTESIPLVAAYSRQHPAVLSAQILEAHAHMGLAKLAQQAQNTQEQSAEATRALSLLQPITTQRPYLIESNELLASARELAN